LGEANEKEIRNREGKFFWINMKVLVPLAEGFEEIEVMTIVDILRRAEIEVVIAGLKDGLIEGAHKILVQPEATLDEVKALQFDVLYLAGGFPGFINLREDERVLNMVREMDRAGKYIAAICGAPSVLVKSGMLKGRTATVNPAGREEVAACARYSPERVVVDGNLITSQSPGTAMELALKMVDVLAGKEVMEKIKAQILAICPGD
jgi:4-methyl-5(b-hydroxyethyl)-thiazole monophosphate biosynthesis